MTRRDRIISTHFHLKGNDALDSELIGVNTMYSTNGISSAVYNNQNEMLTIWLDNTFQRNSI